MMINLLQCLRDKDAWMLDDQGRPWTMVIVSRKLVRKVIVDEGADPEHLYRVYITIIDMRGPNSIPLQSTYATDSKELTSAIRDIKFAIVDAL